MKNIILILGASLLLSACHGRKIDAPRKTVIVPAVATADSLNLPNNAEFWLEHVIENGDQVYAIAARLQYDTSFVRVMRNVDGSVRSEGGTYLGSNSHLTVTLVNGAQGQLLMAYSKQGEQAGAKGNGLLWRVRMRTLQAGTTTLKFDKAQSAVLSPNFNADVQERLTAEFVDGLLEITGAEAMRIRLRIVP